MSRNEITVVTLARSTSAAESQRFAETIWKFHLRCQFTGTMRHIIVDATAPAESARFRALLSGLPSACGIEWRESAGTFGRDFNAAFGLVNTKYALLFLPDHVLEVQHEDFISDGIHALDMNPDVYQVHLSGPYTEWTVEREILADPLFVSYVREHNPFRVPYYPWFRIDRDHLWYGGRLLHSKGVPAPGNPLVRREVSPGKTTLWVSEPLPTKTAIRSQAQFIATGGYKHLAFGFNGAPCLHSMEILRNYLPIPESVLGNPADVGELYFYRHTDIDAEYATAWLNAQTFFWHWHYGWGLTAETDRALFREILMRKEL